MCRLFGRAIMSSGIAIVSSLPSPPFHLPSIATLSSSGNTNRALAIHAVDRSHQGASDSSVLYIPATPLTEANASYLATQRAHFLQGIPAPDFPGGVGEEGHVGHAGLEELHRESVMARRAMGMERWEVEGSEAQMRVLERANEILGF